VVEAWGDRALAPDAALPRAAVSGLGPHAELGFFLAHLLAHFPPYLLAAALIYLFLDVKVFVVSASLSHLSLTLLALAHLLYPLQVHEFMFPVQIVHSKDLRVLEQPGPSILGLHASLLEDLKTLTARKYVLVNADVPYITTFQMEPMPFAVSEAVAEFHDATVRCVRQKAPAFPAGRIAPVIGAFFLKLLGPCIGKSDDYETFCAFLDAARRGPVDLPPFGVALMQGKVTVALTQLLLEEGVAADMMRAAMWPSLFDPLFHVSVKWPPPGTHQLAEMPTASGQAIRARFSVLGPPGGKKERLSVRKTKSLIADNTPELK
jgi:hypothetical protein